MCYDWGRESYQPSWHIRCVAMLMNLTVIRPEPCKQSSRHFLAISNASWDAQKGLREEGDFSPPCFIPAIQYYFLSRRMCNAPLGNDMKDEWWVMNGLCKRRDLPRSVHGFIVCVYWIWAAGKLYPQRLSCKEDLRSLVSNTLNRELV